MEAIALEAGLSPADVRDCFPDKAAILEAIYAHCGQFAMPQKPSAEACVPILESGTAEDILGLFAFPLPEPAGPHLCMVRVVLQRMPTDARAGQLYRGSAWATTAEQAADLLQKAADLGRPGMPHALAGQWAQLVATARQYLGQLALMPVDVAVWQGAEADLMRHLSALLAENAPQVQPATPDATDARLITEAIRRDALSVGEYYHYFEMLKHQGNSPLLNTLAEIIDNTLGHLGTLHTAHCPNRAPPGPQAIAARVLERERENRLALEKALPLAGSALAETLAGMAEMNRAHEQLCQNELAGEMPPP